MFEIGSSLREARERRGVGLNQVEHDTAIRTRYIRALEDERFEVLPGPTYTRGFLRAYADYLGLDGQLFVDEFNSRFLHPGDEFERSIASRPRSRPLPRRRHNESLLVIVTLAAIVVVAMLVFLVAFRPPPHAAPTVPGTTVPALPSNPALPPTAPSTAAATSTKATRRTPFRVDVKASGSCWVQANLGTSSGRGVVAAGGVDLGAGYTLDPAVNPVLTFSVTGPVILQLGAPGNVTLTIDGRPVTIPPAGSPAVLRVTARGVAAA
ncbi:MAG TPA: helix-turn-helix domain-containing protein [Gaiellales bacterium]|nr:helix-turn-helix domain-containing protein [Gaiellales bacterium]